MQGPEDRDIDFLETVVLDIDVQADFAPLEYDGGATDVLSEEVLRLIQQDLD